MPRIYSIGDLVFYDAPNTESCNHVRFVGRIDGYESACMSCADETPSYLVTTQYGERIVCESVLRRSQ